MPHKDHTKHAELVARYVAERRVWPTAYKREYGCVDCGVKGGRLDFDHRRASESNKRPVDKRREGVML